ncbi:MAG: flagellar assembly protein T N-terminal domain-containing protein [Desulfonatronovibrionaceae bacterium]
MLITSRSVFLPLLLCLVFIAGLAGAEEPVTVVGTAPITAGQSQAKQQALEQALRAAVEKGVGTLIDSKTTVENYQVLSDKIYSQASGYVNKYDVLSEGPSPDGSMYSTTIQAVVSAANISTGSPWKWICAR